MSELNEWVYNTTAKSDQNGQEYHVWEKLYSKSAIHPENHIRFALTHSKFGHHPPQNLIGSYGSAEGLYNRTGVDIRGRESSIEELTNHPARTP